MTEIEYRGFRLVQYTHGNGRWVIYNQLGHQVGHSTHPSESDARTYIDDMLLVSSRCNAAERRGR